MDDITEAVKRTREIADEALRLVDEMFPEDAQLPPRTTEYRMYSEDRGE
jgi:hypothetical protein